MTTRKHAFYGILALVSLLGLGMTQSARASFMATIDQVGPSVVGTGSGTFDLTALTLGINVTLGNGGVAPAIGVFATNGGNATAYSGVSGPTSFGVGGANFTANSASGNVVQIWGGGQSLFVPQGYPLTGGNPLSGTFTFNNATFASLGLTPGTYEWTWGTGAHADSFTLQIGPAGVPDTGSTLSLLGFASLGLVALRRKLRC
jgi:hypothetical protein